MCWQNIFFGCLVWEHFPEKSPFFSSFFGGVGFSKSENVADIACRREGGGGVIWTMPKTEGIFLKQAVKLAPGLGKLPFSCEQVSNK